ncbi:MAG TPA: TonB-dependent receptor [Longimicrobiales bacterium]|nr:TonB-dependent receptor [Longimicrobiales bacterium]
MPATIPSASTRRSSSFLAATAAAVLGGVLMAPQSASGQAPAGAEAPDSVVYLVDPVVVTATRGPRAASAVPGPVSVIQRRDLLEQAPNTIADLFRTLPGLDVTGVGVNQVRPRIRGQSGQRILLLADGLRMNNTRRQRDFGELPALVDVATVEQVEVVRGPGSVLYGSDAIGGVVNIITEGQVEDGFRESLSYLYGSAAEQGRISLRAEGRRGPFSLEGGAMSRNAESYDAPSGSFGDITLSDDVTVLHSGVEDGGFDLRLGYDLGATVGVFAKAEHYRADEAGFGFVHPDDYAPGDPVIEILYPEQRFTKLSAGLRARDLDFVAADALSLTVYGQDNERQLVFDAFIPFFPGAGLTLDNRNFTDIRTYGFRAEARKLAANAVLLTYGVDGFRDRAEGTDLNTSVITGFGPPMVTTTNAPSIPHAEFSSVGAFLQGELDVGERLSFVAGGRYQHASAETITTPNLGNTPGSQSHSAWVGALNGMLEVADGLYLVASTGRGFRSPNLVELFFDGAVAEAGAYQAASEGLEPETSLNVDIGARYVTGSLADVGSVFVEAFYFRNKITDGIRARPVLDAGSDTIQTQGLDTYRNVNIDEIVVDGVEVNADFLMDYGITFGGSFSTLSAEDAVDPENPIGESYSKKVTGRLGYRDPEGRFWGQWEIRHSGEQKDAALGSGNPLGGVLPAFTAQGLHGGVRLGEQDGFTTGLTLAVANLTNELYAETANASFFRPEPKRHVTLGLTVSF